MVNNEGNNGQEDVEYSDESQMFGIWISWEKFEKIFFVWSLKITKESTEQLTKQESECCFIDSWISNIQIFKHSEKPLFDDLIYLRNYIDDRSE